MKEKGKKRSSPISGGAEGISAIWHFLTGKSADDVVTPRKNLCVSIEKDGVSVAFVTRIMSKIKVKGVRKYTFDGKGYPGPEDVLTSVFMATKELEAEGAEITLSIPKAWAIMRTATFPAAVRDSIETAIKYELDRLTPYEHDEAYYGFRILEEEGDTLSVALYVAKEDILNRYLETLSEKGIVVKSITVNIAGLGAILRHMDKNKDSLFIDVDEEGFEGALFIDGYAVEAFSGRFPRDDDRSKFEFLLGELIPLRNLMMDTIKEKGDIPHLVILDAEKNPLLKKLAGGSEGFPVTTLEGDFATPQLPSKQHGISYAALGGALESCTADGIDLLTKGRQIRMKTPIALTAIIIIALAVLLVYRMISPLQLEKKALLEIDRQIRARKGQVTRVLELQEEVKSLKGEVAAIREFKEGAPLVLNVLKEITTNLPESAWVTTLKAKGTSVIVSGYAESSAGLLSRLEGSSYLKKVEFMSPTLRDRRTNLERFSIKMEVEGAGMNTPQGGEE